MVITAILHPWYIPDTSADTSADTYSIHHVRDFSAATSQDRALNPVIKNSVSSTPIPSKYIVNTSGLHMKYIVNTAFMYLAGSFHCFWGPVWASTSAQCVRPEAWSVGAPCGCLTSSGFCWTAPYRACWNIHALSAKKHVCCCHAMAVPTLQEPDPWAADAQNWMPW